MKHADTREWGTIGGTIEIGEDPAHAAIREAREEANIDVELDAILGVLGGPEFHVRYPNGNEAAYVTTVFGATVVAGVPRPDGDETIECEWFSIEELDRLALGAFARATFERLSWC